MKFTRIPGTKSVRDRSEVFDFEQYYPTQCRIVATKNPR
jgi:hypothetical protein